MNDATTGYGTSKGSVSLFLTIIFFLVALFFPLPASGGNRGDFVDHLVTLSREKHLSEKRYWHILLHYQKHLTGVASQIDDPAFFLAKNGKTDPRAELEADIRALFQPDTKMAKPYICRFYGRFTWLKKVLDIAPSRFADRTCKSVDQIHPRSVSLIFPTYYMNNPASMFGHTLLAIDTGYSNKRLWNAVNYAAFVPPNVNGLSFTFDGLFGFYKGYYSFMPYYKKIQEYGDINQRDIWEYKLNLKPDEIRRMLRHLKELEKIYTHYYFFDENCSYNLLFLLEAARPSVHLTDQFPLWVIPIDTIRAVERAGLIQSVSFRPSKATRIRYEMSQMAPVDRKKALEIVHGKLTPEAIASEKVDREKKIRMLDLATDCLQYAYVKEDIAKADYRKRLLATLSTRSRLGKDESPIDAHIPVPPRPDLGHDSGRISLGGGVRDHDGFLTIRYRPALTDLTDMDFMPHQGAQIEFLDTRFRYYPGFNRFQLQRMDLISIISISPRDAFFKPFSWKFDTGFFREPMRSGDNDLFYRVNGGGGIAAQYSWTGLCYAMAEAEGDVGGALKKNYAIGVGIRLGAIQTLTRFWKSSLYGRAIRFGPGDSHTDLSAGWDNNFKISRNNFCEVDLKWENIRHHRVKEAQILWHCYF